MGPTISDYNMRLISLTVIQLSGGHCTDHSFSGRPNETIHEESEPDEFWNSIGGQGAYSKCSGRFDKPILEPRLFHCKMIGDTGKMVASEVHNFEKDVSILDFYKKNIL